MNENEIRSRLTTKVLGQKVHIYETLDSTNTRAKMLALENAPEGTVVVAEEQTAGHGRFERLWCSEKGRNLTFSVILKPKLPRNRIGMLSIAAGLAVAKAITETTGRRAETKWPNDVLLNHKKVCGVLSESIIRDENIAAAVVGIGVNVNQLVFPQELTDSATSLLLETGRSLDRTQVFGNVLGQLEYWYNRINSGIFDEMLEEWHGLSMMMGKTITLDQQGKLITGVARRIAGDGGLILQSDGKEMKILSGDVTVIRD